MSPSRSDIRKLGEIQILLEYLPFKSLEVLMEEYEIGQREPTGLQSHRCKPFAATLH
jgi:hypothetical protein